MSSKSLGAQTHAELRAAHDWLPQRRTSGGNKTKTCTFTLNGGAAVTANVQ